MDETTATNICGELRRGIQQYTKNLDPLMCNTGNPLSIEIFCYILQEKQTWLIGCKKIVAVFEEIDNEAIQHQVKAIKLDLAAASRAESKFHQKYILAL